MANVSSLAARGCASCPASVCPTCAVGQMCQQLFRPALDCTACPSNICVVDPSYRAPSRAPIGGAVGGALGALALSAVLLMAWRLRRKKLSEKQRQMRLDAKVRAAEAEQFRPKRNSKGSNAASAAAASRGATTAHEEEQEEELAEDVEWTQMRPDGLTTFVSPPGTGDDDISLDMSALGTDAGMKRRSTGAATHLSRITEGQEEEEERQKRLSMLSVARGANARYSRAGDWRGGSGGVPAMPDPRSGAARGNGIGNGNGNGMTADHARVGSSSSISLAPAAHRASYLSTASGFSGPQSAYAPHHANNPFADGASIRSASSGASSGGTHIIPILFSPPGSAGLDGAGSVRSGRSSGGAEEEMHDASANVSGDWRGGSGGVAAHGAHGNNATPPSAPARAARATGAPLVQLSQGRSSPQRAGSHPSRPVRSPELNLRLNDARQPLSSPTHDFRNLDPSTQPNFPSALAASNVYARQERPLSTASGMSVATAATGATSATTGTTNYARQPHQLHSLAEGGGVKRVQLGRAAAQLVRTPSAARRAAAAGGGGGGQASSPRGERSDPFSDVHSPTASSPLPLSGGGELHASQSHSQRPQSNASSIAGLSVFDGIPFMHSPTEPMPMPASPAASHFDRQEQLRTPTAASSSALATARQRTPSPHSTTSQQRKEPVSTGAKADVESLRLQHELDAFPFKPLAPSPTGSRAS